MFGRRVSDSFGQGLLNKRGISLLELCIVTVFVFLLCAWSLPGLWGAASRHQAQQLLERLAASIDLAKNEALTKRRYMLICGSTDGKTCSAEKRWGPYWLVGQAVLGVTPELSGLQLETLLSVHHIPDSHTLTFGDMPIGRPHQLIIRPNGQTYNNGTFTCGYFDKGKPQTLFLTVSQQLRTQQK